MANVLGTLFADIASAIREKSGDTATMKPAEFPDKIAALTVGGGGASKITFKSNTYTPTSSIYTVNHNMGVVPVIIITWLDDAPVDGKVFLAVGFSSAMYTLAGGGYFGFSQFFTGGNSMSMSTDDGFESASVTNVKYGQIHSVDENHFTIGGSSMGVATKTHSYMAIGGITG